MQTLHNIMTSCLAFLEHVTDVLFLYSNVVKLKLISEYYETVSCSPNLKVWGMHFLNNVAQYFGHKRKKFVIITLVELVSG